MTPSIRPDDMARLRRGPWFITALYLMFGAAWIVSSDTIVSLIWTGDAAEVVQTYKGLFYILVTGVLLFLLAMRHTRHATQLIDRARQHESALHTLREHCPVPLLIVEKGRVTSANLEARRLLGEAVIGTQFRSLVDTHTAPLVDSLIERTRSTDEASRFPVRLRRADARDAAPEIDAMLLVRPLDTVKGDSNDAVQLAIDDHTDLKKLEGELRRSQRLEVVGRLAAGVAHDFNNSLTAIAGYSHLARSLAGPASPVQRPLKEVELALDQAAGLVDSLITLSRTSAARFSTLETNDLLRDAARLLGPLMPRRVALQLEIPPAIEPPLLIWGDAVQLRQAILNLALNARDAISGSGSVSIGVSQGVGPEDGRVLLHVSDTGTGLSPEVAARLFEPFVTSKPVGKGVGLGLSLVKEIIDSHDGTIRVDRSGPNGTVFVISLPRVVVNSSGQRRDKVGQRLPTSEPTKTIVPSGQEFEQNEGSPEVILAEDNTQISMLAQRLLAAEGLSAMGVSTIAELVAAANRFPAVRLLIVDINLPDGSGIEAVKRCRELLPDVPVILTSGGSEPENLPANTEWLPKPFAPIELRDAARRLTQHGSST